MFTHEIRLIHLNGESVLATREFDKMFSNAAYRWFDAEAYKHFPKMFHVADSTIAGFHYRNDDGTVVLEMR